MPDWTQLKATLDADALGAEMQRLCARLFPICRSITGDGFRQSLRELQAYAPLSLREVPSGTAVHDWEVPKEWNIRDAYIKDLRGERVVDFRKSNLHVVSYSVPVRRRMRLAELRDHLFTLPDRPTWIPYRTTYYKEDWGFCLSHEQYLKLADEEYEVCIDSTLEPGHLTYGECYLPGDSPDEILISCHACHPSLCNDNLSGMAVTALLARTLGSLARRYSYRLLWIPGTIGSIAWLALHPEQVGRIRHGLVVTGVGDAGGTTYKRSRRGDAEIDRAMAHVLEHADAPSKLIDFFPYGYDERQYCSPGYDLPVGCLMRTPHGSYPEYHTSADDLDFVKPASLADSLCKLLAALEVLEKNRTYVNRNPKGEVRLGKRGLYRSVGGDRGAGLDELALLWVLNLADGRHDLLAMAERSRMKFAAISGAADALLRHGLLDERPPR